ncbi:hypothetical protein ACWFRJ_04245 [Streptomyces sp. NPDC055239]
MPLAAASSSWPRELRDRLGIGEGAAMDAVATATATATGMAGALWQMSAPGTQLCALDEARPELAHARVDV